MMRAVASVDRGAGVIILTDMFGGTPCNLAISVMEAGRVEVIAGLNLPMLVKLVRIRGEASLARARENALAAYQGGVVSLIEVLDADGKLLQARDAKAQAHTEAARAAIASFRALGGGWDAQHASSNGLSTTNLASNDLSTSDRR